MRLRGPVIRSERGFEGVSALAVPATVDPLSGDEQGGSMPQGDEPVAPNGTESMATADEVGIPSGTLLSGADMFIKARVSRRVRLPASLRQGRHGATGARQALGVMKDRSELPAGA